MDSLYPKMLRSIARFHRCHLAVAQTSRSLAAPAPPCPRFGGHGETLRMLSNGSV